MTGPISSIADLNILFSELTTDIGKSDEKSKSSFWDMLLSLSQNNTSTLNDVKAVCESNDLLSNDLRSSDLQNGDLQKKDKADLKMQQIMSLLMAQNVPVVKDIIPLEFQNSENQLVEDISTNEVSAKQEETTPIIDIFADKSPPITNVSNEVIQEKIKDFDNVSQVQVLQPVVNNEVKIENDSAKPEVLNYTVDKKEISQPEITIEQPKVISNSASENQTEGKQIYNEFKAVYEPKLKNIFNQQNINEVVNEQVTRDVTNQQQTNAVDTQNRLDQVQRPLESQQVNQVQMTKSFYEINPMITAKDLKKFEIKDTLDKKVEVNNLEKLEIVVKDTKDHVIQPVIENKSQEKSEQFEFNFTKPDLPKKEEKISQNAFTLIHHDNKISNNVHINAQKITTEPQAIEIPVQDQVAENLLLAVKEGKKELNITLTPENLGEITLQVTSDESGISAKIVTDNLLVKDELNQKSFALGETLKDQGVKLSNLEVHYKGNAEGFSQFTGGERQKQQQHYQQNQTYKAYNKNDTQQVADKFMSLSDIKYDTGFNYLA